MRFPSPSLAVPVAALLALPGCASDPEQEFAQAVVSSSLETSRSGMAGKPVVDAVDDPCAVADPEAAAAEAASRPVVGLYPASCATKSADGASVHVELDGCTGPFGKVTLQGGLDAVFSPGKAECTISADIADSGNLTANGRALDYDAHAEVTVKDGERDVDWTAHFTGTTRRGQDIEQSSHLGVVVDRESGCIDAAGDLHGTIAEWRDYGATISGLRVCPDHCPEAGTVDATVEGRLRDRSIQVRFDGSKVAHVTGWSGREFDVDLVCEGE